MEDLYAHFPEMVNHPKRFLEPNFSFSGKESSKCRPTFNSSASYSEQDIAQNSLFLKGGNINKLIRCFLAFRLHEYGSSVDLSRAFYFVKCDSLAVSLRRLWLPFAKDKHGKDRIHFGHCGPDCNCKPIWREASFSSVVMGDIQGMAALLVAIHTAADLFSGEDRIGLLARRHLKDFSYADDCITFSRLLKDRDQICQRIDYILTTAGFWLHGWLHASIPAFEGEELKTVTDRTGYQLHYETCGFCGKHHNQDSICLLYTSPSPRD